MSLALRTPDERRAHARLAPYARHSLEEAARFAHRLHADELTVEHLFSALLFDEESGAAQVVLHAFADPETLATEILAMCPGITVVGSARCLPFAPGGVRLLLAARARAAAAGAARVEPLHLLAESLGELPGPIRSTLREAGVPDPDTWPAARTPGSGEAPVDEVGALFRNFSNDSKRALSAAGHQAVRLGRGSVSAAHVLLGCLEVDGDLRQASALTPARARAAIGRDDADESLPPPRELAPSPELLSFLGHAPEAADTVGLLGLLLERGEPELQQLFLRQKVAPEVVERCRGELTDPEPPTRPSTEGRD